MYHLDTYKSVNLWLCMLQFIEDIGELVLFICSISPLLYVKQTSESCKLLYISPSKPLHIYNMAYLTYPVFI